MTTMTRVVSVIADTLHAADLIGLAAPLFVSAFMSEARIQVNADDLAAWIEWTSAEPMSPFLVGNRTHFHATASIEGIGFLLTAVRVTEEVAS